MVLAGNRSVALIWQAVLAGWLMLAAQVLVADQVVVNELRNFKSQQQRDRYQALIEELRCPQCQNQNLEDSDSPIAQDLRNTVFRLLEEGMSDREIVDYMVQRYGDFITYLPRVQQSTLLLWLTRIVRFVLGGVVFAMVRRQRKAVVSNDLSVDEQHKLDALLSDSQLSQPDEQQDNS